MIRLILFLTCLCSVLAVSADQNHVNPNNTLPAIKFSVGRMPVLAEKQDDPLPQFAARIGDFFGQTIEFSIIPFKRSVEYIKQAKSDIHFPFIYAPKFESDDLPYLFSSNSPYSVNFVLYTHNCLNYDLNRLEELDIYTDFGLVDLFTFEIRPSTNIAGAIKMVDEGRIDALIFADTVVDPIIKAKGYKNIQRSLYSAFEVRAILAKTERAVDIDKAFSRAVQEIKDTGEIMDSFNILFFGPYVDWQPDEGAVVECSINDAKFNEIL